MSSILNSVSVSAVGDQVIARACPDGGFGEVLAAITEGSPNVIVMADAETLEVVYHNRAAHLRFDPEGGAQWRGVGLRDLVAAAEQDRLLLTILADVETGAPWSGMCGLRDLKGKEFQARLHVQFFENRGRRLYVCNADLLTSKAEENEVLSDHRILRALLDTVPDAIYLKDAQSRFVLVSRSMASRCGHRTPEEMIGRSDFDYFTVDHAQPAYEAEQRIITRGEHVLGVEEMETWIDGLVTWVNTTKLPLYDNEGQIIGLFGISRDITLQKADALEKAELEAKLQLAGKLESVGRLSAGVAHEINTPTQFIAHNTRFIDDATKDLIALARGGHALQRAVEKKDASEIQTLSTALAASVKKLDLDYLASELPRTIAENIDGLARVQQIVKSLKEYAHPASQEKIPSDINAAIQTSLNVAKHEWKYVADTKLELAATLPKVACNVGEINQVLLNLIVNAAHAIESKLRKTGEKKGLITVRSRVEGSWVVIEIEDSGTGIPETVRARIFDPFFTTKPMGKGTGQGLHVAQTIVATNHGGQLEFDTELGRGTTFRLRLPL